jgi:hypothetical protein
MATDAPTDATAAIEAATTLSQLESYFDVSSEHEAYLAAKGAWRTGVEVTIDSLGALPGTVVHVGDTPFWIHGVTHADTDAERTFLRDEIQDRITDGGTVYCEQGIRRMYFQDVEAVCEMDDYRWAMARCRELAVPSHVEQFLEEDIETVPELLTTITDEFRETTFSLIEAGRGLYGERFAGALGDVASAFLTDHADMATREEYEAFSLSRRAAKDPTELDHLQAYYHRSFLPQPLEREWLRRHDPELEIVTHARNERMAAYALGHHEGAAAVHLVVGAAHQPGVAYYLQAAATGHWTPSYEPVA